MVNNLTFGHFPTRFYNEDMEKIRIRDIAEQLGLSVATVSNVLNGKKNKISPATEARVLKAIEESGYLPHRAEVLMACNPRSLVGFVVNDHPIYEGKPFEDPYISQTLSALIQQANAHDLDIVSRSATDWQEIVEFASTWNMKGLILSGFCQADYSSLSAQLHIPLVIYNGKSEGFACVSNNDFEGGRMLGEHLKKQGCKRVLCLVNAIESPDLDRVLGLKASGLETTELTLPASKEERLEFYSTQDFHHAEAIFCVSDLLALELIRYLNTRHIRVPEDCLVCGFDGISAGEFSIPSLTTVRQNFDEQAIVALNGITDGAQGIVSSPFLIERESTVHGKDF